MRLATHSGDNNDDGYTVVPSDDTGYLDVEDGAPTPVEGGYMDVQNHETVLLLKYIFFFASDPLVG